MRATSRVFRALSYDMPPEYRSVVVMLRAGLASIVVLRSLVYTPPAGTARDPLILVTSLLLGAGIAWGAYWFQVAPDQRRALWVAGFEVAALFVLELLYGADTSTHFYTLNIVVLIEVAMIAGLIGTIAFWFAGAFGHGIALAWEVSRRTDPQLGDQSLRVLLGLFVAAAAGVLARELQKAVIAERSARLALDRSERAKSALTRLVSHDLRNPLAVVTSYAHLLATHKDRYDESQLSKALEEIESGARRVDQSLEELLEIDAVFGAERQTLLQTVSVPELLRDVSQHDSLVIDAPLIDVTLDVRGTRALLRLMISNTLRHARDGDPITVVAEPEEDRLLVTVGPTDLSESDDAHGHVYRLLQVLAEDQGASLGSVDTADGRRLRLSIPDALPKGDA